MTIINEKGQKNRYDSEYLQLLDEANELNKSKNSNILQEARIQNAYGNYYLNQKNYDLSVNCYQKALSSFQKLNHTNNEEYIFLIINLADSLTEIKKHYEAATHYAKAFSYFTSLKESRQEYKKLVLSILKRLAYSYAEEKRIDKAKNHANLYTSYALDNFGKHSSEYYETLFDLAIVYKKIGDIESTMTKLKNLKESFGGNNEENKFAIKDIAIKALYELYEIFSSEKKPDKAYDCLIEIRSLRKF